MYRFWGFFITREKRGTIIKALTLETAPVHLGRGTFVSVVFLVSNRENDHNNVFKPLFKKGYYIMSPGEEILVYEKQIFEK